jgi:DNA invertase Pin-like site-specific DNA recombinase
MQAQTRSTESDNRPRCAIYARCASGTSTIDEQIQRCREAAAEQGWVVQEDFVFHDGGSSGTSLQIRHGLNALVEAAKLRPKPYDTLLVDDTSRLARDLGIAIKVIDDLNQHDVNFYFAAEKLDSRDASFRKVLAVVDKHYIQRVSGRVRSGRKDSLPGR